jgi:HDOD domain
VVKQAVTRALDSDDMTGLHEVLRIDPLTAARYLRVANSPLFGRRQGVGSASDAMDLLGRRAAAMIALVSSFDYGFSSRRRDDRLELARRHCLQTAILAEQFAHCVGLAVHAEPLFLAGLLHDIAGMLRPMESEGASGVDIDSTLGSADLLGAWHLPRVIVDAIAELGHAEGGDRPPAPGPGRVLWMAHEFAPLMMLRGEPDTEDVRALTVLLQTTPQLVLAALRVARERYAAIAEDSAAEDSGGGLQ